MKIVNIFADRLFAFHYAGEEDNEYDRLLDLWDDIECVFEFLKANESDLPHRNIEIIADKIMHDAELIDDSLMEICNTPNRMLDHFFAPLDNNEYRERVLSLQKGRASYLRLYAIRIDKDLFVITGGAIKFHHWMQDRVHTNEELNKLKSAQYFLQNHGIIDEDSFYEFLNESNYD